MKFIIAISILLSATVAFAGRSTVYQSEPGMPWARDYNAPAYIVEGDDDKIIIRKTEPGLPWVPDLDEPALIIEEEKNWRDERRERRRSLFDD